MRRNLTIILAVFLCMAFQAVKADDTKFSERERKEINVPTAGLFDDSNFFEINLSLIKDCDYCFPLSSGNAYVTKDNDGLKISANKETAVKAMFEGDVRLSYRHPQYGNVIVVRHANGLETLYADNAQNLVFSGAHVKAGQTIAIVGGMGQENYCSFSIMADGQKFDPATVLDIKNRTLRHATLYIEKKADKLIITSRKNASDGEGLMAYTGNDPFRNVSEITLNLTRIAPNRWSYPLPGAKVISPYGGRRRHSGVDLKTVPNDKVLAAFDGVVVRSGPYAGYGNCIEIKHADGLKTLYGHQSKNLVKEGDFVHAGQVIGLTGRTGHATTEHLHFELFFQGRRYDPARLFDHAGHKLRDITVVLTKSGEIKTKK